MCKQTQNTHTGQHMLVANTGQCYAWWERDQLLLTWFKSYIWVLLYIQRHRTTHERKGVFVNMSKKSDFRGFLFHPVNVIALSDTHVFLLNEYFIELNTANFNILNKFLNWILSETRELNQLLNWILLKNENWINFWIEFVEKQKN